MGFGLKYGNADRGPSADIFRVVRDKEIFADMNSGFFLKEDFLNWGGLVTTNAGYKAGDSGMWKTFEDTSCSINSLNTAVGGVIQLLTETTDNNEVSLEAGGGNAGSFGLIAGASGYKVAFEARIRPATLAAAGSEGNFFIGLAEKGLAVTDGLFSDSDAIGDKSVLGFRCLKADAYVLKAVNQKNGGGGENAQTISTYSSAATLAAATWVKLGFVYNPQDRVAPCRWFVNGTQVASITDETNAKFPSTTTPGTILTPYAVLKNGAGAAQKIDIDWIQVVCQF